MANYYKEISKMMDKLIHQVLTYDRTGFKSIGKTEELSLLDIYILRKIGEKQEKKIYELVEEMEIDRGIVASSTNKLLSLGYVAKEKSEEDKRVYLLRLTKEGLGLWETIQEKQEEFMNFILSEVSLNEEKTILKFLSRMNQVTMTKKKT